MIENKELVFSRRLIDWGKRNRRDLPWRNTKDPYQVFIAEQLLRKTTVKQVEPIYDAFIRKYPSVEQLAKASENELRTLLTPLGMENVRSVLFLKSAGIMMEEFDGKVPRIVEDLEKLSGVGKYTANAILSMVYGEDVPMVDTNAVRVTRRVFNFESKRARMKDDPSLWDFVGNLIPVGESKEFNIAIIDFGYKVCRPRNPLCNECPLTAICEALKTGQF